MIKDAFLYMKPVQHDIAVLVGGDGDFLPTFEVLRRRGVRTRVLFWRHATSRDLREFADEYVELASVIRGDHQVWPFVGV